MKLAALIQHVRRRQKQEVDRGQAVGVGPQKHVCTEREREWLFRAPKIKTMVHARANRSTRPKPSIYMYEE